MHERVQISCKVSLAECFIPFTRLKVWLGTGKATKSIYDDTAMTAYTYNQFVIRRLFLFTVTISLILQKKKKEEESTNHLLELQ